MAQESPLHTPLLQDEPWLSLAVAAKALGALWHWVEAWDELRS